MYYIKVSYCRTGYLDWVLHLEELETNLIYTLNLDTGFICITVMPEPGGGGGGGTGLPNIWQIS